MYLFDTFVLEATGCLKVAADNNAANLVACFFPMNARTLKIGAALRTAAAFRRVLREAMATGDCGADMRRHIYTRDWNKEVETQDAAESAQAAQAAEAAEAVLAERPAQTEQEDRMESV
jgi:hypothetical protein